MAQKKTRYFLVAYEFAGNASSGRGLQGYTVANGRFLNQEMMQKDLALVIHEKFCVTNIMEISESDFKDWKLTPNSRI